MDAIAIVASTTADELRHRVDALDQERRALMVLLRAARARERSSRVEAERREGGKQHGA